jgi:3-methyladenine DNA glycosylase AlkD
MSENIRKRLIKLSDKKYKEFISGLIQTSKEKNNMLGIRLPILRAYAKELAKGNWKDYFSEKEIYSEETLLKGMIIGYAKMDIEERLKYIKKYIPKIDNWGTCDSFCNTLKFTKGNEERVWEFIQPYLKSDKEFEIRFGIVMIICYFIKEEYIDKVLKILNSTKHDGYYVKMAVAWALAECYVKFPEKTMILLKNNRLRKFTYNKALQKIIESYKVDDKDKDIIRGMRRK